MISKLFIQGILLQLLNRSSHVTSSDCFPDDFKFGVATSAYQIEGAWNEDGKGPNIFDRLLNVAPNPVVDGSNGNIACDSYHLYEEDIQMIKNLSVDFYRFSLSWSRILPNGVDNVINQKGVDYYLNILNRLEEEGIEPLVTIFHWDLPQQFAFLGQWSNPHMIEYFTEYARVAFELFGHKVKRWITFNEPFVFCGFQSTLSGNNPDYLQGVYEYLCAHTVIKAHAEVYHLYSKQFKPKQNGKIAITLNFDWFEPATSSADDLAAAERRRIFQVGWFASPLTYGNYPKVMIDRIADRSKNENFTNSRLPSFNLLEKSRIRGTYDFFAMNHYTTYLVSAQPEASYGSFSFQNDLGVVEFQNGSSIPTGFRKALNWVNDNYGKPEIYVTENGYGSTSLGLEDQERIDYYQGYLENALAAIQEDGVRLKAYTAWSLMDDFEWVAGYTVKFGLYEVDFNSPDRTRTPRLSAAWYKNISSTKCLSN